MPHRPDFFTWLGDHVGAALAICAALIIVWQRTDNRALGVRMLTLLGSALFGAAMGGEVAGWTGWPPNISYAGVTVLGPLALETAALLVRDPNHLVDLYNKWRGK